MHRTIFLGPMSSSTLLSFSQSASAVAGPAGEWHAGVSRGSKKLRNTFCRQFCTVGIASIAHKWLTIVLQSCMEERALGVGKDDVLQGPVGAVCPAIPHHGAPSLVKLLMIGLQLTVHPLDLLQAGRTTQNAQEHALALACMHTQNAQEHALAVACTLDTPSASGVP